MEWRRFKGTIIPGVMQMGGDLSDELRHSFMYENFHLYLETLPFFENVSRSFIAVLCQRVKKQLYGEGEVILYEVSSRFINTYILFRLLVADNNYHKNIL